MTFTARKTLTALGAAALIVGSLVLGANTASAQTKPFSLSSPDLASGTFDNQFVLNGFGCKGGNVSPALQWDNLPAGTKKLALSVYDPDAPTGSGWWHWVVYNLPADTHSLAANAGAASASALPAGAVTGRNDYGSRDFGGACPPPNTKPHRYIFTVYALKVDKLDLPADASPALIGYNLLANQIASAKLVAKYGR